MKNLLILVALSLAGCYVASAQDLNNYIPIEKGYCEDVALRCVSMIPIDTPMFYAVFSNEGQLIAITKMTGSKETVVWGKLPPKKGEIEL